MNGICHVFPQAAAGWIEVDATPIRTRSRLPHADGMGSAQPLLDGLACFVQPGVVLAELDPNPDSERHGILMKNVQALEQATDARGRKLEIHFIKEASEVDAAGDRFCRSYINFYIANGGIVMPAYGIPSDERARTVVASCFPGRKIVQVDIMGVATGGGGIHCITQQQPA
jgi:agmatine deiminase